MAEGHAGSLDKHREWVARVFASGRVPHGVLLAGAPGSGKLTLALEMARRFLCHAPDPDARPCGTCIACRETDTLRYPDVLVFSSRDITPEARALAAIIPRAVGSSAGQILIIGAVRRLLYRVANRVNGGFFRSRDGGGESSKSDEEDQGRVPWLERSLADAPGKDPGALADVLRGVIEEIVEIDNGVQHSMLPMAGIQEIIRMLSRRPLLGERRVVLIEGIHTFRVEGVNAFLKTLEEPPAGTMIIMTCPGLDTVLPTIRSRAAILPFRRPGAGLMQTIAREVYGCSDAGEADGFADLWSYLEAQGDSARAVQADLLRFLELVRTADRDPALFDFAKDLEKRDEAQVFLQALADLVTAALLAAETGYGRDTVHAMALSHFQPVFLRRIHREVCRLAEGLTRNNLSAAQGIVSLVLAFWLEEQGAG